jgi:PhoH-like ATPase
VHISKGLSKEITEIFKEDNADHRILSVAMEVKRKLPANRVVILVTKDVNLRMKEKAIGIPAEDYSTDRISNVEELYSGKEIIEDFNSDIIAALYKVPFEVQAAPIMKKYKTEYVPNKYLILRNQNTSVLTYLDRIKSIKKNDKVTHTE